MGAIWAFWPSPSFYPSSYAFPWLSAFVTRSCRHSCLPTPQGLGPGERCCSSSRGQGPLLAASRALSQGALGAARQALALAQVRGRAGRWQALGRVGVGHLRRGLWPRVAAAAAARGPGLGPRPSLACLQEGVQEEAQGVVQAARAASVLGRCRASSPACSRCCSRRDSWQEEGGLAGMAGPQEGEGLVQGSSSSSLVREVAGQARWVHGARGEPAACDSSAAY